jgi:hypothetical protein
MDRRQRPYRRDCRNAAESEKDDVEHGELVQGCAGMHSFSLCEECYMRFSLSIAAAEARAIGASAKGIVPLQANEWVIFDHF